MRTLILISALMMMSTANTNAQWTWGKIKKEAKKTVDEYSGSGSGPANKPSDSEVVSGLREALTVGAKNAASRISKVDGYNKDPLIRIPFPPKAQKVKETCEKIGLKSQVEKFELTLNRAAEEAGKEAAPIFVDAIKSMTVQDGWSILKGGDNAATTYLKNKTQFKLKSKFRPVIKKAIQKVEVTKYWNPLMNAYNKVPGHDPVNQDLETYILEKALDGLFLKVADEEKKIRKDPVARVSDLLKKVFGYVAGN